MAAIIETWGVIKSAPYIQGFHAAWSFGSLLGPFIVRPFVHVDSDSDVCGNKTSSAMHDNLLEKHRVNDIFWPYMICSVVWLVGGLSLVWIGLKKWKDSISEILASAESVVKKSSPTSLVQSLT